MDRIEVVILNCPSRGTAAPSVEITENSQQKYLLSVRATPCDSFVRVCLPHNTTSSVFEMIFLAERVASYTHIAEVAFYRDSGDHTTLCPQFTIVSDHATNPLQPPPSSTSSSSSSSSSNTSRLPTNNGCATVATTAATPTGASSTDPKMPIGGYGHYVVHIAS